MAETDDNTARNVEWADSVAMLLCNSAEADGWLGAEWRTAWWMLGSNGTRCDALRMLAEPGEVMRWDSVAGGCVWVGLTSKNALLRVVAACAPGYGPRDALTLPWEGLKAAALRDEPVAWKWWWAAAAAIRAPSWSGKGAVAPQEGKLGIYEMPDGTFQMGRIERVLRNRAISIVCRDGLTRLVKEGGRGWVWNARWAATAEDAFIKGKDVFQSLQSGTWTMVNHKRRLIAEGVLPDDDPGLTGEGSSQN